MSLWSGGRGVPCRLDRFSRLRRQREKTTPPVRVVSCDVFSPPLILPFEKIMPPWENEHRKIGQKINCTGTRISLCGGTQRILWLFPAPCCGSCVGNGGGWRKRRPAWKTVSLLQSPPPPCRSLFSFFPLLRTTKESIPHPADATTKQLSLSLSLSLSPTHRFSFCLFRDDRRCPSATRTAW